MKTIFHSPVFLLLLLGCAHVAPKPAVPQSPVQQTRPSEQKPLPQEPPAIKPTARMYELAKQPSPGDMLLTRNGSRFVGSVVSDTGKAVTIQTKYATLTIPVSGLLYGRWNGRERNFGLFHKDVIKLEDGRRLIGDITARTDAGFVIETEDGEHTVSPDEAVYVYRDYRRTQAQKRGAPTASARNESAVRMALHWLWRHQNRRQALAAPGAWDVDGYTRLCKNGKCANAPVVSPHFDLAATGLSVLAYLGNGHTHRVGLFKKSVKAALEYLKRQQDKDGWLGKTKKTKKSIYNHAIGTWALCEAYAVTRDWKLKEPCKRAIKCIIDSQNPDGGWGLGPQGSASNTLLTAWMVLAFKAAKCAGLEIPREAFEGALKWFDNCTDPATGLVGYKKAGDPDRHDGASHEVQKEMPTMTAAAVICSIFCGMKRSDPRLVKSVDVLMNNLPDYDSKLLKVDMWYWYFGTYVMFQYGGMRWQKWHNAMKKALLNTQRKDGCANGSWDPKGILWGVSGGRVWCSALNALTLEIYYRHARAYPRH